VRRMGSVEGLVILACVALTALFGFACALNEDGDFNVTPCLADQPSCEPDELARALPCVDSQRSRCGQLAQPRLYAWGLLSAVPGGLCLLI
jgi:hypothetical protein